MGDRCQLLWYRLLCFAFFDCFDTVHDFLPVHIDYYFLLLLDELKHLLLLSFLFIGFLIEHFFLFFFFFLLQVGLFVTYK